MSYQRRRQLEWLLLLVVSNVHLAPIGGVLFSLEELSTFFPTKTMIRSFFCALMAVVTLQLIDPFRGKRVMFQVFFSRNWYFFEMLSFCILGVFGGLSGALFIKGTLAVREARSKWTWMQNNRVKEVAILAASTAIVSYLNTFTRLNC